MTMLSVRLSRALAKGRRQSAPDRRYGVLVGLLRKRAMAHAQGDVALEALLRDQIRWALPIERP